MFKIIGLSSALLLSSAITAFANVEHLGTTEGDWEIIRDTSDGKMCLMTSQFSDETHIQLIADVSSDKIIMTLLNAGWTMVVDQDYPLEVHLDGNEYEGTVTGFESEGLNGLYLDIENTEFLSDLMSAKAMTLVEDGEAIMSYDLIGTMQAVPAVFECLE